MADGNYRAIKKDADDRAIKAVMALLGGKPPPYTPDDSATATIALENVIALVLDAVCKGNARMAAGLLNEMVGPGAERQLAQLQSLQKSSQH